MLLRKCFGRGLGASREGWRLGGAFSLTLPLSRWERGQLLDFDVKFEGRGAEDRRGFAGGRNQAQVEHQNNTQPNEGGNEFSFPDNI